MSTAKKSRTWLDKVAQGLARVEDAGDRRKLEYALGAYAGENPFGDDEQPCVQVLEILKWIAQRNPERIITERENMITALEEAGQRMWASGLAEQWYVGADPVLRAAVGQVNGHLLEQLLRATGYHDWRCAYLFRQGRFLHVCICGPASAPCQVHNCWVNSSVAGWASQLMLQQQQLCLRIACGSGVVSIMPRS